MPDSRKDFSAWHKNKAKLHEDKQRPFFREGEVWFCSLGVNVGFEQDGRGDSFLRPIVVLKKFNNEICWGIPLTKIKRKGRYYFSFTLKKGTSTAILSQIRLIDAKRLHYKFASMKEVDFAEMKKRLSQFLV